MAPESTISHKATARTAAEVCVSMSVRRLSKRSATTPPHTPNSSMGRNCSATMKPRADPAVDFPVSSSTSQLWAVICIHVPVSDTSWEKKNSR